MHIHMITEGNTWDTVDNYKDTLSNTGIRWVTQGVTQGYTG